MCMCMEMFRGWFFSTDDGVPNNVPKKDAPTRGSFHEPHSPCGREMFDLSVTTDHRRSDKEGEPEVVEHVRVELVVHHQQRLKEGRLGLDGRTRWVHDERQGHDCR
jgi:hypothetical protein